MSSSLSSLILLLNSARGGASGYGNPIWISEVSKCFMLIFFSFLSLFIYSFVNLEGIANNNKVFNDTVRKVL